MKILVAAMMAVIGAGCVSTMPPAGGSMDEYLVSFSCDNNDSVSVRFFPSHEAAILTRNGGDIELKQKRSASGFVYSNGPNTIRGKGDDLTVEIGRMMPIHCKAR